MNHSTPGLPVHHQLTEFTQTHVHWVSDAIQPSHPLSSSSPPAPNTSQPSGSFPVSQLFAWGGQSIGVSASASVHPVNTQDWSPLGWTEPPIKINKLIKKIKRGQTASLLLFQEQWYRSQLPAICKIAFTRTKSCYHPDLRYPASKTMRNKLMLLRSQPVFDILLYQAKVTDTLKKVKGTERQCIW